MERYSSHCQEIPPEYNVLTEVRHTQEPLAAGACRPVDLASERGRRLRPARGQAERAYLSFVTGSCGFSGRHRLLSQKADAGSRVHEGLECRCSDADVEKGFLSASSGRNLERAVVDARRRSIYQWMFPEY